MKILKSRLLYFILGTFALWYVLPYIPVHKLINAIPKFAYHNLTVGISVIVVLIISTVLNMFFQFGLIYELCKLKLSWKKNLLIFLISIVCLILSVVWIEHYLVIHKPNIFAPNSSYINHLLSLFKNIGSPFIAHLPQRGLINFFIILLSFGFGSLLSNIIKEKNLLLPVMICCAFIDLWTCTIGFVSKTLAKAPEIVSGVSSGVSMIGGSKLMGMNIATIGPGDFIFASLVFACVFKFGLNGRRNFIFMLSFLTLGMLLIVLGILPFLPALICIALGTIISNYKNFDLNKQEKISVIGVFTLLLILYIVFRILK